MPLFARTAALGLVLLAAASDGPAQEKPAAMLLTNPARDIRVLSDRDEPFVDYFRRNRILVCRLWGIRLTELIESKKTLPRFFVSSCSQNDDEERVDTFGARPDIAAPSEEVVKLLNKHLAKDKEPHLALILCRDAKAPTLYHVVGCLEREPRGFFARDEKNEKDGFSPKELSFKEDAKK